MVLADTAGQSCARARDNGGQLKTVTVKFEPSVIAAIDDARRKKTPIPSRSDVIRELVDKGLPKSK